MLNRNHRIELMKSSAKRHEARFSVWMENRTVREVVCRPAPGQVNDASYTEERKRVAC